MMDSDDKPKAATKKSKSKLIPVNKHTKWPTAVYHEPPPPRYNKEGLRLRPGIKPHFMSLWDTSRVLLIASL
jgi:hypothetical protein